MTMPARKPLHVPEDRVVDFDVYDLAGYADDFFLAWRKFQESAPAPLVWTPHNGGHWIVTSGALIHELFADTEHLSSGDGSLNPALGAMTRFIPVQSDPPDHAPARSALLRELGARHLLKLEPEIRFRAKALVDELRPQGQCEFMSAFAEDLPISVFLTILGLPLTDRPMLRDLVTALHRPDGSRSMEELVGLMHGYLAPYVAARRAQPGEDLLSRVLAGGLDGRPWSEDEAMRLASNLLVGGLDTVAAMMGFTMQHLANCPSDRKWLVANPHEIEAAADEFTRRFGMTSPSRRVVRDLSMDGVTLCSGDRLILPTPLHNLDDRCFPDAQAVRLDRGTTRHSTMGNGPHRCVGAGLARIELIILLEEWLAAIPDFHPDPERPATWQGGQAGTLTALPLIWTSA